MKDLRKFNLRLTNRAQIIFEEITGRSFNPQKNGDIILLYHSILLACNQSIENEYTLTFDEFIDALDQDPTLLFDFIEWFSITTKNQNDLLLNHINKKQAKVEDTTDTEKKN